MAKLVCFGFGYCAEHFIMEFGGKFERVIGTVRRARNLEIEYRGRAAGGADGDGRGMDGTSSGASGLRTGSRRVPPAFDG